MGARFHHDHLALYCEPLAIPGVTEPLRELGMGCKVDRFSLNPVAQGPLRLLVEEAEARGEPIPGLV